MHEGTSSATTTPDPRQDRPRLYDTHMHTPLCKHARGEPEAYADAAIQRGLTGIIITCHNPLPDGIMSNVRMEPSQFDEYLALVERARQARQGQVDVRLGMECDYWPGLEPFLEKQLQQATFHHVLGSVHCHLPWFLETFAAPTPKAYCQQYFEHLALAAESGLFDTLAHPDLVKNVCPDQWRIDDMLDCIRRNLDRIARTGVAMEFNTSGIYKKVAEYNPNQPMLAEMAKRGIPVVMGSDAHDAKRVGADFDIAIKLIRQAGYEHVSYFLDRKRVDLPLDDAPKALSVPV